MRVLAFLDGTFADPDQAHIRVDDLGLIRGDGIFETILVTNGVPRELDAHLDRFARSAAKLDMAEPDRAAWERVIQQVIEAWPPEEELALKIVLTRGVEGDPEEKPTAFAYGMSIPESTKRARRDGIAVVTLNRGFEADLMERAPWLLLGAKTLSYSVNMSAQREARRRGAEDVIFTSTEGYVLEGPTSNVVLARGKTLYTPPPTNGILPGTTQGDVFRAAERAGWKTEVTQLKADELTEGDALMLASSVRKLTRVHTLDGTALPDSSVAIHAELAEAYDAQYA
ncbi:aminodeoxychorismate lyase [Prauserella rugosa]|uniref:4-amino-4-deoxychorismate lyase n=1 Tax=Prauserella rugosa TaxID=43354 RepID=A0A660CIG8_9PSEU|nr:aminodeoxychorismate lyase [Prauserella rugosa]KMS90608.1 4-amino-4-deoxychorismate lyase [Streptomyces regensis]TWH21423.1 4-amino-4-deoxychorismate lyase [Prauserella rugosa]